jgi:hypothetical protein
LPRRLLYTAGATRFATRFHPQQQESTMKKTITKKLIVSKATVRHLGSPDLANIVGGVTARTCTDICTDTCRRVTCIPR